MKNPIQIEQYYSVEKTFYKLIQAIAFHRTSELDRNRVYDGISILCEHIDEDDALDAVACLKHLVENQRVPLIAVKRSSGSPIEYILK